MKNLTFFTSLHERGLTVAKLAALIGSGRAHVNQVINNKPGRGHFTRRRLIPHLAAAEKAALGWTFHGEQSSKTA